MLPGAALSGIMSRASAGAGPSGRASRDIAASLVGGIQDVDLNFSKV